jgi:hypothetical protein
LLFLLAIGHMEKIYKAKEIELTIADYTTIKPKSNSKTIRIPEDTETVNNEPMRRICEKILGIKIDPNERHPRIVYKTINCKTK